MKKPNIFITAAFLLSLTFSAQANLSSDALDFVRQSISAASKNSLAPASESLAKASAKYADLIREVSGAALEQADTLRLIKKPLIKGDKVSPGIILRKDLYVKLRNPKMLWIGLVVPKLNLKKTEVLFNEIIAEVVKENPTFKIDFVMPKPYFNDTSYNLLGNVNNGPFEVMMYNMDEVKIAGQDMVIVNIPISSTDNIEDALTLLNIIDTQLAL